MPSKNGFNKPKDHMNRARKAQNAAKRTKVHTFTPTPTSVDLYTRLKIDKSHVVTNKKHQLTTHTLSNKKLRKIERNLRYLQNSGVASKVVLDIEAKKQESMELDEGEREDEEAKEKTKTLKDQTEFVRDALWAVVDDEASQGIQVDQSGEGTTLGYAGFY